MPTGSLPLPGSTITYASDATPGAIAQYDPNGGMTAKHLNSIGSAPAAAPGSNAGSSPPAPVVAANSTDTRGSLTCGTGTSAAAGNLVTITFNTAYAVAPFVALTPNNSAAAALVPYVTSVSTTGFTIAVQTAPGSSQANTTYGFSWQVLG